jgi:hypothetical protein
MRLVYDPVPRYPPIGGNVQSGWDEAAASLRGGPGVLAVDGPSVLGWEAVMAGLEGAFGARGIAVDRLDLRSHVAPWELILERTASVELPNDPDFATLASGTLEILFDRLPHPACPASGWLIVYGPGAALVRHDVLWYVDLPKRFAEMEIASGTGRNLGQRDATAASSTRRLFYIDWPLLDRHREAIAPEIARYVDAQDVARPCSIDGETMHRTASALASRPFRTRPTFNSTPWGGHWAQRELRMSLDAPNTALGYELIAPEAGVLIGDTSARQVELPFQLIVAESPGTFLGERIHLRFGTSFPIRFDYLDTVEGGNLSVHCHPVAEYMTRKFGWPYTQHETYYVMIGGERQKVFLGLRSDVDVGTFHRQALDADRSGLPFDVERFVQAHPADPHRLFSIPAGTPHGSGAGNVILEVSATPYLYSLRLYDWLRRTTEGGLRSVHVEHAFANLDTSRTGRRITDELMRPPGVLRQGSGWREEVLSRLPEVFFEVHRMVIETDRRLQDTTADGFHVINVVEGNGIVVHWGSGEHALSYGETLVLPAAVGAYEIVRLGSVRTMVVKALLS